MVMPVNQVKTIKNINSLLYGEYTFCYKIYCVSFIFGCY